jgi:hypothetical protein
MRSITLKMVFAFLGIALISIVLIVLLARWNTGTEFSRFVVDRRAEELVERFTEYYRSNGTWEGLETVTILNDNLPKPGNNLPPGAILYAGQRQRTGCTGRARFSQGRTNSPSET